MHQLLTPRKQSKGAMEGLTHPSQLQDKEESSPVKVVKEETNKTAMLAGLTSSLLFILAGILIATVGAAMSFEKLDCAAFITTLILACFSVIMALAIRSVYSPGVKPSNSTLDNNVKHYQLCCVKFRIRKCQDFPDTMPKLYFVISALWMIVGSVVMMVGDLSLVHDYMNQIKSYSIGLYYIHASFGPAFIISALLNLILCCKANKIILFSAILVNLLCIGLGTGLLFINNKGITYMRHLASRMSYDTEEIKTILAEMTDSEGHRGLGSV